MMPFQAITLAEVKLIFQLSEGQGMNDKGKGEGHSGARHVSITNSGLGDRLMSHSRGGIAAYTAFRSFDEQVAAAHEVLNLPANDAALEDFRVNTKPGKDFELKRVRVGAPTLLRYARGDGGAATFPCTCYTLILRKDLSRPHGMHIITFFGEMG
jgi:hypothetical protein